MTHKEWVESINECEVPTCICCEKCADCNCANYRHILGENIEEEVNENPDNHQ